MTFPHSPQPRIGLVLGAGGIRGAAHAAVVEALEEAGIPVHLVVGASTGALYGLGFAAGVPAIEIGRRAREAKPLDLLRFYAGRLRPSRRNPIGRLLLEAGVEKHFSDLVRQFAVTATDIHAGKTVVLDSGPILPAVQASIALPFIARPVEIGGRFYADGGLLDTLPVAAARSLGADIVIGVRLGHNYQAPSAFRRRPWTRDALLRLGAQRDPSRLMGVDQVRFFARLCATTFEPPPPSDEADVTIWPEFGRIGPNSMAGSAFCYEQGLIAARAALPRIQQLLQEYAESAPRAM